MPIFVHFEDEGTAGTLLVVLIVLEICNWLFVEF